MKLLHTSDWHFGMTIGQRTYEEDQRHFLEQLYEIIETEQVDAVLCAGDVYDSSIVNADAISLYNEAATTICAGLGRPLIVIAGNHDSAPRLATCRELLRAAGLYVTGRLTRDVEPVLLDGGRAAVYPLPFFGRDEVIALFPEKREEIRSQETAMKVVCDHIRETMDPSRSNIVMAHALIVSAELSESDRSARIGHATAVSQDVFEGFDYVALGHIHKPQAVGERVRYCGSPVKYSFGSEENQQKGVVIVDTETMEQRFVPLKPWRERLTVKGTLDELLRREDLADAYLRLYVTDRYSGLELMAALQEKFPNLLELYGKGIEDDESFTALTVDELERMDEGDIMQKFLQEVCRYQPTEAQAAMFRDALATAEKERDEQ